MVTTHPPTSLTSHCPIRDVLSVIGDKWTAEVMFFLAQGTQRLSTLQRAIPDASKKMLIQTLRKLEHDGLVERTVYPVVPPKAEYRLTPLGHHMLDPIMWLCHWAMAHQEVLAEVQAQRAQRPSS